MKKLLYILFLLIATVKINYAQSVYIKVGNWGVATASLLDGKIKYESIEGETLFGTSVTFQRFEASTQVRVQAIYVFEANGSEINISDSIFVNTADFINPYLSKEFIKFPALKPNNKNGIVKLKWRYLDTYSGTNTRWSSYYYAAKTYGTINVAVDPGNPPVPGSAPVYSYYNLSVRDHFSTLNPDIVKLFDGWRYDGINFYAFPNSMPGTIPIYDFYNARDFNHLTTPNRNETDGFQGWEYRGIAFYAYDHQVSGTVPIYSFYNRPDEDHFISPNRNATDGFPNWEYRGIVFYAFPK